MPDKYDEMAKNIINEWEGCIDPMFHKTLAQALCQAAAEARAETWGEASKEVENFSGHWSNRADGAYPTYRSDFDPLITLLDDKAKKESSLSTDQEARP